MIKGIELKGTPKDIADKWADINSKNIRKDLKIFLDRTREKYHSLSELIKRSKKFIKIANKYGNHWLEEAHHISKKCQINPDLYIAFIAGVYRNLFTSNECTSYTISSRITQGENYLFHKTRDNIKKPQSAFILQSSRKKINKFIAISDASVIGCMMMVNEKGLAGSADWSGFKSGSPFFEGVMNVFILRHIAEKAESCEEAVEIIEEYVKHRYYAGGLIDGTHWLFVDKSGKRYEVSNNATEVKVREITEEIYFSCYRKGAKNILQKVKRPISFEEFHQVSRNRNMCFDSSIAGLTVEINPAFPEILTCAWVALPAKSYILPIFMGGSITPIPLLNGDIYKKGDKILLNKVNLKYLNYFDKESHTNKLYLEKYLKQLLELEKRNKQIKNEINKWTLLNTEKCIRIIDAFKK